MTTTAPGATQIETVRATDDRPIPVRRISFDQPGADSEHFFCGGDPVMSHIVATLSGLFPEGEDYFVRSVRIHRDQIDDPELRRQVKGFIGQEAIHGREHRVINDSLTAMGYKANLVDRFTGNRLKFNERVASPKFRLAVTAALEHYTATLAEILLRDPEARAKFGDGDEMRDLLLWHAVEENEHKAVAFDVYQTVYGDSKYRARVMKLTTFGFLGISVIFSIYSLLADPQARKNRKLVRKGLKNLRTSPWLSKEVRLRIRDYNRPDFHPDDHDTVELLAEWRELLFGTEGTLTDKLAG